MNQKDVRSLTTSLLETALSVPVYSSKVTPALIKNLPAVIVFTPNVAANGQSSATAAFTINIDIEIDVLVAANEDWCDTADDLLETIKDTLFTSTQWTQQFVSVEGYTIAYSIVGDTEKPLATATLTINTLGFTPYAI